MWNYGKIKETSVNFYESLICLLNIRYQGIGCKDIFIHESLHVDRILNIDHDKSDVMKHI